MNINFSKRIILAVNVVLVLSAFFYIQFVVQPWLIFHHTQPSFICNPVFYKPFFKYPGGLAELTANLVMQSFYTPILGSLVFLAIVFTIGWLTKRLMDSIYKNDYNLIWAAIPLIFSVILTNNYNFPFSVIISIIFLLLVLFILSKIKIFWLSILAFTIGAVLVYWLAGSGYMLIFSASAVFVTTKAKKWRKVVQKIYILLFTFLFPLFAFAFIFMVSPVHKYLWFYSPKAWFMKYEPSSVFILLVVSIPVLLAFSNIFSLKLQRKTMQINKPLFTILKISFIVLFVLATVVFSHFETFDSDAKKIVQADYYSYKNKPEETAKSATTLKNYNFKANLDYNLVMLKKGKFNENFFGFMQIKGTEGLFPDIDFASELSFISSDFYYELGFISEARHWAYESLVFYPYSIRALQSLVKIHLINREYKAAEELLKVLDNALIGKDFVREYQPYVKDTMLISGNNELIEKRSFIPAEKELNVTADGRFRELLAANSNNKAAYENLMMFYLLTNNFTEFSALFKSAGKYFDKTPAIYEEALLMNAYRNGQPLPEDVKISSETQNRYNSFVQQLEQFKGQIRLARNSLYAEFGKTYMYYLQFVYPHVIETEIVKDEDDYPAI